MDRRNAALALSVTTQRLALACLRRTKCDIFRILSDLPCSSPGRRWQIQNPRRCKAKTRTSLNRHRPRPSLQRCTVKVRAKIWSADVTDAGFIVRDHGGQARAVHPEEETRRQNCSRVVWR